MSSVWLDLFDSLDIIGNGSFGIIRKVRRRTDGMIFARKELNFQRMAERDRKQIVAEVNILKDLHHDHIVRYHDRYVDRDAGVLYILMEYCGGGDLSSVIKQAAKHNRPIPEETVWNYLMQILLALQHCHHPNAPGKNGGVESEGNERRSQILHRDLKPDNVFLDESNKVKLGDFGLSKALAQASFANTYVGTPYYMSPELMQEKAYDSKSDIWSLGCLVYELCALKPPFHEARTHSELSICIRNGRIPPLPRGYSQGLSTLIKAMLNLNPAMRPSATQLLQHERLEFAFKVSEMENMLAAIKGHRADLIGRERDVAAREDAASKQEQHFISLIAQKDVEIASLKQAAARLQEQQYSQVQTDKAVRDAVVRREEELRVLVMKREKEVAEAMARREEEIMEAVRKREAEVFEAWGTREAEMDREIEKKWQMVQERIAWLDAKENELRMEDARLEDARTEFEQKLASWQENAGKDRKEKTPLEEVQNIMAPLARLADETPTLRRKLENPTPMPISHSLPLFTPLTRPPKPEFAPSAMKGVVLTATGESLATPTPTEVAKLFNSSPKVGLNFGKIFDFESGDEDGDESTGIPVNIEPTREESPPPSPSSRKNKAKGNKREGQHSSSDGASSDSASSSSSTAVTVTTMASSAPPTRLRRPSIRTGSQRRPIQKSVTVPASAPEPFATNLCGKGSSSTSQVQPKPLPHPHLNALAPSAGLPARQRPSPEYDLADEENLPSPFLKRTIDRAATMRPLRGIVKKRQSGGTNLRAVAAANAVGKRASAALVSGNESQVGVSEDARPALANARKASEEARKALSRP